MKILLIEDTPSMAENLLDMLKKMNCQTDWAMDGKTALHKHQLNTYDLIISDYCLPDTKGCHIAEKIRLHDSKTPIIGLTTYVTETQKQDWMNKGAQAVYQKPLNFNELKDIVDLFKKP